MSLRASNFTNISVLTNNQKSLLFGCLLFVLSSVSAFAQIDQSKTAPTPPMGWNSYNAFGAAVHEDEVRANAEFMAKNLKQHGWQYVVVDYCWSYPHPPGSTQNNPPQFRLKKDGAYVPWLPMDQYGRLQPEPTKFPSSSGGKGFKPLADYIHSLGLKFGIHVMRGIPRQAVWAKSPVLGTNKTAEDIVDTTSVCPWLNQMWGVNMKKDGAQDYYNSLAKLYAEWGVDFIKMDDTDLNDKYPYRRDEVEAMRKAIEQCGRPIVLSLSLAMKYENREHAKANAEMWRVSRDFWDEWPQLKEQFEILAKWAHVSEPGNWPDADMLQLGKISKRGPEGPERYSRFTPDEQRTHMTMWCIFRSPLMMGGNMPENTSLVNELLTNQDALNINQYSRNSRQLFRKDELVVWTSESLDGKTTNVALFNLNDEPRQISVSLKELGLKGNIDVQDVWNKKKSKLTKGVLKQQLPPHASALFTLFNK